ncbi:MAG TPA: 50S ribosomal protein L15 [bacterium]|nr:50S ribosomal protein L15 [bacterium]
MSLTLSNLSHSKSANHKRKRIGRGNASGHGTSATRGIKGQKARSGVSGLKRLGMKQMLLQVPKTRGFKSHFGKKQVVNFTAINLKFKSGELVNPLSLAKHGLIKKNGGEVKILSNGELTIDKLTFSKVLMSASAEAAVLAKGGKVPAKKIIPQKKKLTKKVK